VKNLNTRTLRRIVETILCVDKISMDELKRRLRLDSDTVLYYLSVLRDFLGYESEKIFLKTGRVDLLENLLRGGTYVDLERIARCLSWQDFEELIKRFFREFGYRCVHRLRIPVNDRRVEIDIVAYRHNIVLLADAKRYVKTRVRVQLVYEYVEKIDQLCKCSLDTLLQRLYGLSERGEYYIYPVIITVHSCDSILINDVPIVPIYKLRDFLYNFYDNRSSYRCFVVYRF